MSTVFNFYTPTPFNSTTKEQLWLSQLTDSHDTWCGCVRPISHLLSLLFTEEHKDRHLTIHQIIVREHKAHTKWLSTGIEEGAGGGDQEEEPTAAEPTERKEDKEEDLTEEAIEDLIRAADDAEQR